ncbi:hypothetical protein DSO57_1031901 [Entomophthora muscae]|uniref:Uncharacterized protein n=1 Tax=Entomophthora muscae TaxID=34485 RepID=A0ACC2TBK7_9FUNG|nr:hypothetical protein DSO57_1031901 [Entomophthora muscae]
MENEAQFRSLDETGFRNSSEHQEISSNISALDRFYESGSSNMAINSALQPFGFSVNGSQDQSQGYMMSQSLPVHSGVAMASYEMHNSNEPLPPPQSPQVMSTDNMVRAITDNIDAFASPLRNTQLANLFAQPNSPSQSGKVKCLLCPNGAQLVPFSDMAHHFTSEHPTFGKVFTKRRASSENQAIPTLESRRNFVSKYYIPINSGVHKGKKKCSNCEVIYSATTSSSILSRHLSKVHRINPRANMESSSSNTNAEAQRQRMSASTKMVSATPTKERSVIKGPTPSPVWIHFAQVDIVNLDGSKVSVKKCHHCDKAYSVNTSNSGLARHLFSVHCIRLPCFVTVPPEDPDRLKGDENRLKLYSAKCASSPKEITEAEKEDFECDMADDFSLPSAKDSPPQGDPLTSLFTVEAGSDGVSVFKKCRHCGKHFDLSSSKFTLFQHLSSHSNLMQFLQKLEERAPAAEAYSTEAFPKVAKSEERNYHFLQIVLSKFVLSNPEPSSLLQNEYFQEIIKCFDPKIKSPSLDECKLLATFLEGIRNLPVVPGSEANPVWAHFLEQNSNRQCLYCHFVFPSATSTFSLSRHLGTAHANLFPSGFPPPPKASVSDGYINALYSLMAQFLITDLRPASLLEQELFQKFLVLLGFIEPPLSVQSVVDFINDMYRDQLMKIEAQLKSALSRVTVVVDLFDLKSSGSVLVISYSFIDSDWKPRRIVTSVDWNSQPVAELDLEVIASAVLFRYTRCLDMQLPIACLLVNARVRNKEVKDLLEQQLREKTMQPLCFVVSRL